MRTPVLALLAGLFLGLTSCAGTKNAWQDFRMPGADFAVSMPGQPKVSEDSTEKDGTVSRGYLVDDGTIGYAVHYSVFPAAKKGRKEAPVDALLDEARDDMVRSMNAKLHNERRFAFGESRATELILDVPESKDNPAEVIKVRLYLRRDQGHRTLLYQTIVFGPQGYDANANVTRFLDSFHFVTG